MLHNSLLASCTYLVTLLPLCGPLSTLLSLCTGVPLPSLPPSLPTHYCTALAASGTISSPAFSASIILLKLTNGKLRLTTSLPTAW